MASLQQLKETYTPPKAEHRMGVVTNTPPTGFKEFAPRDPERQAKYSAMSPSWEGLQSSKDAIARGDYDLDYLPRKTAGPSVREGFLSESCSIQ